VPLNQCLLARGERLFRGGEIVLRLLDVALGSRVGRHLTRHYEGLLVKRSFLTLRLGRAGEGQTTIRSHGRLIQTASSGLNQLCNPPVWLIPNDGVTITRLRAIGSSGLVELGRRGSLILLFANCSAAPWKLR